MPTYEYECKKCGERFDVVQSFTDEPLKRHKGGCGGSVKRVFGSVGISFKGSGFYKTDNRSSSSKSSSSSTSESKASESSTPKSDTKSDTSSTTPSTSA
ncbi:MAG TPA: FmdB family zinc ribbon protein [Acidimicrobiales bacterium]|nr:FmdB family zinc ribbon protein [Acidimicrobiales bacterium]